jgi:DNA primase
VDRDDLKRRVQEATDIVRLVGEHVALRPRGREFVGLCAFHEDKNPSMYVNPAKQIFKCFACGAGGDVFSFVMDYHKMSFPEAIKFLAEKANIAIPKYSGGSPSGDPDAPSPRQRILTANQQALKFYRDQFHGANSGAIARDYTKQRNITPPMVESFQIGYAPDAWDVLSTAVTANKWDREAFVLAGLLAKRQNSDGWYDKLRHRLIFPILDNIGRPIAFGGRVMPGGTVENNADAKYLNSPETPLFNKSATLFGLHAAQKPIIDSRTAVIVEGYTDVIGCHQAGVKNVVATLGTALTAQHAQILRRYCDKVILVFDGDEAGQKAADRALQVFFSESIDIAIAVLPDGLDPDELLAQEHGRERWQHAMDTAADAMGFQFARLRQNFDKATSMTGRQHIADEYLRTLVGLGLRQLDRQRYGLVFARLGDLLGMSPAAVQEAVKKIAPGAGAARNAPVASASPEAPVKHSAMTRAERHIVGCLLSSPPLFHAPMTDGRPLNETIVPVDFADATTQQIYAAVYEWLMEADASGNPLAELRHSDLRGALPDEGLLRMALDMQMEVEQLTQGEVAQVAVVLGGAAAALMARVSQQEYEQHKLQRPAPADSAGTNDNTDQMEWLRQTIAQRASAPPSATSGRSRLIGSD